MNFFPGIVVPRDMVDLMIFDAALLKGQKIKQRNRILDPGVYVLTPRELENPALNYLLDVGITGRSAVLRVLPNPRSNALQLNGIQAKAIQSAYPIDYRTESMNIVDFGGVPPHMRAYKVVYYSD